MLRKLTTSPPTILRGRGRDGCNDPTGCTPNQGLGVGRFKPVQIGSGNFGDPPNSEPNRAIGSADFPNLNRTSPGLGEISLAQS